MSDLQLSLHEESLPATSDFRTIVYDETAISGDWTLRRPGDLSYRHGETDEEDETSNLHAYFIPSVSFLYGSRRSPETEGTTGGVGAVGSVNGLFTMDLWSSFGSGTILQLGTKIGTDVAYASADDTVSLLPNANISLLIIRNADFIEHCGYLIPGALNNAQLCFRQDKFIFSAGAVFRHDVVGNDSDVDYGWQLEASFIPSLLEYFGLQILFRHYPEEGDYEFYLGLLSLI